MRSYLDRAVTVRSLGRQSSGRARLRAAGARTASGHHRTHEGQQRPPCSAPEARQSAPGLPAAEASVSRVADLFLGLSMMAGPDDVGIGSLCIATYLDDGISPPADDVATVIES